MMAQGAAALGRTDAGAWRLGSRLRCLRQSAEGLGCVTGSGRPLGPRALPRGGGVVRVVWSCSSCRFFFGVSLESYRIGESLGRTSTGESRVSNREIHTDIFSAGSAQLAEYAVQVLECKGLNAPPSTTIQTQLTRQQ